MPSVSRNIWPMQVGTAARKNERTSILEVISRRLEKNSKNSAPLYSAVKRRVAINREVHPFKYAVGLFIYSSGGLS
jgi:hypothetical protein